MRLFLAINLPTDVRETLWEVAAPLRTARYPVRWVAAEAIHLTLKFLGDVDDMREDEIAAGVAAAVVGAKPFPLPVGGFGAFPSAQRPRVVWAGLEPVPSLELLQHRVEQEMERLGFPTEGRPFHPHLTLGRVKRDARPAALAGLATDLDSLVYETEVSVESVDLMQSTLTPQGAQYTQRHVVALA
jgi:2'-5' RNA ligase